MARDRTYKPTTNSKKLTSTQDKIDSLRADAKHAQELLDNPYLKSYCNHAKKSILDMHAKQLIYDATEESEQNGVKSTKHFPAVKEYTMLAGEYRFIDRLISDLKQTVFIASDMEERIRNEEIEIAEVQTG